MFWTVFETLCENKGMSPNGVCKELGLSNATATHWKNGKQPSKKTLALLSEYFSVSPEYLMAGVDLNAVASADTFENNEYSWSNEPKSETEYRYNAAIRAVAILHGNEKGYAMLSAIRLPADKPTELTKAQKEYLAFKSGTNAEFFDDDDLLVCSPEELTEKAESYRFDLDYRSLYELKKDYPEAEQWDNLFRTKYINVAQKKVDMTCLESVIDTLSGYRNEEQYKILAMFLSAVEKYEEQKHRKVNENYTNAVAKKDSSVS